MRGVQAISRNDPRVDDNGGNEEQRNCLERAEEEKQERPETSQTPLNKDTLVDRTRFLGPLHPRKFRAPEAPQRTNIPAVVKMRSRDRTTALALTLSLLSLLIVQRSS